MPVRIDRLLLAGAVERRDMRRRERPAFRAQVLAQLLFVPGADDDGGNGGPLQEPVQCDLGNALFSFFSRLIEGIDDFDTSARLLPADPCRRSGVGGC